MRRWLICILFWVFMLEVFGQERPVLNITDPDIQKIYQLCSLSPGCKIAARTIRVLGEKEEWTTETVYILRTSGVINLSIGRFKSVKGNIYIVLLVPDATVDTALIKVLGGK